MNQPLLVTATQKAGPRLTLAIGAVVVLLLVALPLCSLLPADHALHVSAYTLTLVGKILCYAIVALALTWSGAMPGCCHWAMACSSPWAAMPWACT